MTMRPGSVGAGPFFYPSNRSGFGGVGVAAIEKGHAMIDRDHDRNGSTNGPTEPNQRPTEQREGAADQAVKGPKIISEGNHKQRAKDHETSPAGPHAKESQTNKEATPGAGALPPTKPTGDIEPGTG
jgi:hypothetical protein